MKISVVIVSCNSCEMLKLALNSVIRAALGIDHEIFVVDNASDDNSVAMLKTEYPEVHVIANTDDLGMASAYNQGIKSAVGEYVLLVNADTITGKKTIEKSLEFMDMHTDAGGLGVRMITPDGRFLQESKVGFIKPWAVFFKLTGLSKYFSKSRLTHPENREGVEEFNTSEADVLNGAFMLLRKTAVNETGLLDDRFHTYGYDIDFSYRMRLAGFKNYYFPKTYIINFNIQNKVKFSWVYLKEFYGAMIIFATKYLFHVPEIKVGIPQLYPSTYEVK